MSQPPLSRELALRIGLAAKALPGTRIKFLVHGLIEQCGLPLTEKKIESLNASRYQLILPGVHAQDLVKRSLCILQGCQAGKNPLFDLKMYRPGDMPHSIRVALASSDGSQINAGFSDASHFYIFQVSADEIRLIAIRSTSTPERLKSEQRQAHRAEVLQDCLVFYATTIGSRAAAKLVKKDVHPVMVTHSSATAEILQQLQYVLANSPPPWLARSMGFQPAPIQQTREYAS